MGCVLRSWFLRKWIISSTTQVNKGKVIKYRGRYSWKEVKVQLYRLRY